MIIELSLAGNRISQGSDTGWQTMSGKDAGTWRQTHTEREIEKSQQKAHTLKQNQWHLYKGIFFIWSPINRKATFVLARSSCGSLHKYHPAGAIHHSYRQADL